MARHERFTAGGRTGDSDANPFRVLGVSDEDSPEAIKKAYRQLAKARHPDRSGDEEAMKDLNEAWRLVTNTINGESLNLEGAHRSELARALAEGLNRLRPAYALQYEQVSSIRLEDLAPGVSVQEVKRAA